MSGVVAAVAAGGAIVGGYLSKKGAEKAGEMGQETSREQLEYMRQAENRARMDINRLFHQADQTRTQGYQQQADLYGQAMPITMDMFGQGNVNAQNVLAGSAPQAMNALLGQPVNFDFMQPQSINYKGRLAELLAGFPNIYEPPEQVQQTTPPPDVGVPNVPGFGGAFGGHSSVPFTGNSGVGFGGGGILGGGSGPFNGVGGLNSGFSLGGVGGGNGINANQFAKIPEYGSGMGGFVKGG